MQDGTHLGTAGGGDGEEGEGAPVVVQGRVVPLQVHQHVAGVDVEPGGRRMELERTSKKRKRGASGQDKLSLCGVRTPRPQTPSLAPVWLHVLESEA